MAEDALKIISLVFEHAGPNSGPDHGHDALILIDLPMDDRPARDVGQGLCQLIECPTATGEVVASGKLILTSQHNCGGLGKVGSESRIHPSAPAARKLTGLDRLPQTWIDEPLRIDRVPHDRVRQTTVSDGPLSGVVVGQSALIDDIGSQPAGVDEMANTGGPRRVNDATVTSDAGIRFSS
jgi:hypothetical protein